MKKESTNDSVYKCALFMICWSAATLSLLLLLMMFFCCYYISRVCTVYVTVCLDDIELCHDIMMMGSSRLHNRLVHYTPIVDHCRISFMWPSSLRFDLFSLSTIFVICTVGVYCVVPEFLDVFDVLLVIILA